MNLRTYLFILGILSLLIASFFLGIHVASKYVVFGTVDFSSGQEDKVVMLNRDITVKSTSGEVTVLKKGDVFFLEGRYDFQSYLTKRFIIENPNVYQELPLNMANEYIQIKTTDSTTSTGTAHNQ